MVADSIYAVLVLRYYKAWTLSSRIGPGLILSKVLPLTSPVVDMFASFPCDGQSPNSRPHLQSQCSKALQGNLASSVSWKILGA